MENMHRPRKKIGECSTLMKAACIPVCLLLHCICAFFAASLIVTQILAAIPSASNNLPILARQHWIHVLSREGCVYWYNPFPYIIIRKVLILKRYISWYFPIRDDLMIREWLYTALSWVVMGCTNLKWTYFWTISQYWGFKLAIFSLRLQIWWWCWRRSVYYVRGSMTTPPPTCLLLAASPSLVAPPTLYNIILATTFIPLTGASCIMSCKVLPVIEFMIQVVLLVTVIQSVTCYYPSNSL